jgi:alkanesulfonate monooxygenase SsuD/methylene tetrahydromethanopterin reductase-like flavin-dependent oxidoreductase (luciferase family)
MTLIGHTMMCEQTGPKQLVRDVALAEEAGFDSRSSATTFSWLEAQGHSPYAWGVLGAAQATHRLPLMTYVTCPIRRYHPAVVARERANPRSRARSIPGHAQVATPWGQWTKVG